MYHSHLEVSVPLLGHPGKPAHYPEGSQEPLKHGPNPCGTLYGLTSSHGGPKLSSCSMCGPNPSSSSFPPGLPKQGHCLTLLRFSVVCLFAFSGRCKSLAFHRGPVPWGSPTWSHPPGLRWSSMSSHHAPSGVSKASMSLLHPHLGPEPLWPADEEKPGTHETHQK